MGRMKDTAALVQWTEEEQLNWASNVLCDLKDKHAKALDMQGWKIVHKDDPSYRWPFSSKDSECDCPSGVKIWIPTELDVLTS